MFIYSNKISRLSCLILTDPSSFSKYEESKEFLSFLTKKGFH
jgi:hypothetical protein